MTQVTVDDVMQGNGHASDDERRSGFECGGWAMGRFADDTIELIRDTYQRADAFLFGRQTYEMFAETWGAIDEMRADPTGVALYEKAEYVASTTLTDPHWANSTVLSGDLASAIRQLKNAPGASFRYTAAATWSPGCCPTTSSMAAGLVDRLQLTIFPAITGHSGVDPIFAGGSDYDLELIESRTLDGRTLELTYRPSRH